jgi:hypothetical protein
MFQAFGLEPERWSTFEFPPPQSRTAQRLDAMGAPGRRTVDVIEAVATRLPGVRRLGCHLLVVARRTGSDLPAGVPAGVWPGPFSP